MTSRNFQTRLSGALAIVLAIVVAACNIDVPTSPEAPAAPAQTLSASGSEALFGRGSDDDDSRLGGVTSKARLFRCATPEFASVTRIIGRRGGEIEVGPHSLEIPSGALRQDVRITATAKAGQHVRIKLEPHGLVFAKPAELRLSYEHCDTRPPRRAHVAYVDDLLNVIELLKRTATRAAETSRLSSSTSPATRSPTDHRLT